MGERRSRNEIDMCEGPLLKGILQFVWPMALMSLLQMSFSMADTAVLGHFGSSTSMGAVGATAALTMMLVNTMLGLSTGVNILVARYRGAGEEEKAQRILHTSILAAVVGGAVLTVVGSLICRPVLEWMETPADIIDRSVLYIQIYLLGVPGLLLGNYGAAALRAVGDTKRPLYYSTIAGVLNVIGNVVFVAAFHLDVAGVALSTVLSQLVSTVLILNCMRRSEGVCHLDWRLVRMHMPSFLELLYIGIPAGLQTVTMSISNILIQSSLNGFGSYVLSGNAAAGNVEQLHLITMNVLGAACAAFVSQNYGAKNSKRIGQAAWTCTGLSVALCLLFSGISLIFGPYMLRIFTNDAEVIRYGMVKLRTVVLFYGLFSVGNVLASALRGVGYSILPMVMSTVGICVVRVVWIYTVFAWNPTLEVLFWSLPVSWSLTGIFQLTGYLILGRKKVKKLSAS